MNNKKKINLDINENRVIRIMWVVFGFLMVGIGVLGLILPVLPGTIFFVLAAFAFAKSSEKFYFMLVHNKYVGPHLQNYLENKFIPVRTKIIIISTLWISITASAVYFVDVLWQKVILFSVAVGVSIYIILYRSKKIEVSE